VSARPGRTAVYRIRDAAGELLYIGMTNSVPIRWNAHMLYQPWWDELRSLTVEFLDTREEAAAAEKAAILGEVPKYNKTYLLPRRPRHRPRRRPARQTLQPAAVVQPETSAAPRGPLLTPEEAAEFLAVTETELAELRHSDPALAWYDLDGRGNYVRFGPDDLQEYKAILAGRGVA
jgi:hypothetical protein